MADVTNGLVLLFAAGLMNASFALPMKYTRRWAWENTWLVWTVFALLVLPLLITWATVPRLPEVYESAAAEIVLEVIAFGAGWGVAQVFFGLAVDAIGIALTFSLVLGTAAAVGTLIPLIHLHPERLNTPAGHGILAGVALVLLGVAVCAVAGRRREKALAGNAASPKSTTLGLALAILAGLGGSFVNLGLSFGAPIAQTARSLGASPISASNAVWMPLMIAGAVPNLLYCLWLLTKNRSGDRFSAGGLMHWVLACIMGCCWFFSTLLYGIATVELGTWGPILGWPLFMSAIVMTASFLGMFTGEWKNAGASPLRMQWMGVALLVVAIFTLAKAG